MTDLLYISFDKDETKQETGLCVGRVNKDGSHTILKMELDSQADTLYKILTNQSVKAIPLEKLEQIREEFINKYPKNYMGEPELNGKSCIFSLNEILESIDKVVKEVVQ